MSDQSKITILEKEIETRYEEISINELKYLKANPRVISAVRSLDPSLLPGEVQKKIGDLMETQPSVKKVKKRIFDHGGLQEPILVRYDTKEVVEGNSRLAAYRLLYKEQDNDEKWAYIRCQVVAELSDNEQFSYLNSVHVEGKTPWTAYEKANMAYLASIEGRTPQQIAQLTGASIREINKRIKTIQMMQKNKDNNQKHFSYYDVLMTNRRISQAIVENKDLKKMLLNDIKNESFESAELRDKLPCVLDERKELKRYMKRKLTLDEAYQIAKPSEVGKRIKDAYNKIEGISKEDVSGARESDMGSVLYEARNLVKESKRVVAIIQEVKDNF